MQLARHLGAEVWATGSDPEKLAAISDLGATPIDYRSESVVDYVVRHTDGAGFDVVYDSVGGANMAVSFEAAALNGHVITTVSLLELDLTLAHFKGLSIHVIFMLIPMLHEYGREHYGGILRKLAEIAEAGSLKPILDEPRSGLAECGEAHARLATGNVIGKIVLEH